MPIALAGISVRAAAILGATLLAACATVPDDEIDRDHLVERSRAAVEAFRQADPSLEHFFENSAGWAAFPSIRRNCSCPGGPSRHRRSP